MENASCSGLSLRRGWDETYDAAEIVVVVVVGARLLSNTWIIYNKRERKERKETELIRPADGHV